MRFLFLLLVLTVQYQALSQVFFKVSNGWVMYSDTTRQKQLSTEVYEACWCEAVYLNGDSSKIHHAIPRGNALTVSVKKSGSWGALKKNGELAHPFEEEGPVVPLKSGKKGVIHNVEEEKGLAGIALESVLMISDTSSAKPERYFVQDEYKGYLLVSQDQEYYGIMSPDLKIVLPLKYRSIIYTKDRFFFNPNGLLTLKTSLETDKKCGMVNYKGEIIFPFKYDFISDYIANENAIFVQINDNRGFVDSKGNTKLPMTFKKLPYVLTDTMLVEDAHYTWFINSDYSIVGDKKYQALDKKDSLWFFKRNGKWGVMDEHLNVFIPNVYESIVDAPRMRSNPDFKAYVVVKNQKYGVISLTGETIIPCQYECNCTLGYFSPDGFFIEFKTGSTFYRFDETGKLLEKGTSTNDRCLCEIY